MPTKSFHRTDRVSAQLRRELGTLVHEGKLPDWEGAVIALPLRTPDQTLGILYLLWSDPADVLDDDIMPAKDIHELMDRRAARIVNSGLHYI